MFIPIGSVLVTRYSTRLRCQLLNNTLSSQPLHVNIIGAPIGSVWTVEINSISVASEVLDLTWAAVFSIACSLGVWSQLWIGLEEQKRGRKFEWNTWGYFFGERNIGRNRRYEKNGSIGQQRA